MVVDHSRIELPRLDLRAELTPWPWPYLPFLRVGDRAVVWPPETMLGEDFYEMGTNPHREKSAVSSDGSDNQNVATLTTSIVSERSLPCFSALSHASIGVPYTSE
jgi:hypothetical protein